MEALKNLKHIRLLRLLGVCTQEEPFFMVTEYLPNGSLLTYLKSSEGQYLVLEEQLHMALQVAEGTYIGTVFGAGGTATHGTTGC